jgi:fluoride exporter
MAGRSFLVHAAVGAGAALGSAARFAVALAVLSWLGPGFPWGTLAANVAGSFLICLYVGLSDPALGRPSNLLLDRFVVAGFCGGFTTFSVFSLEALMLAQMHRPLVPAVYVGLSLLLWLAAGWAGFAAARRLTLGSRGA